MRQLTMRAESRRLQQLMRYYLQYDTPQFLSGICKTLLEKTTGDRAYDYVDEKCLDRSELLSALSDDQIWYFDSAESIQIDEPVHRADLPTEFHDRIGTVTREQPYVCKISDINLVGPTANPKDKDGKYILPALGLARGQMLQCIILEYMSSNRSKPAASEVETAATLHNLYSNNYSHWVTDLLPRLRGIKYYEEMTGKRPTLIIHPNPPDWMLEYLNLFGYGSDDYIKWAGDVINVNNFIVPCGYRFTPSLLRWVRQSAHESVGDKNRDYPSKFYVSRRNALSRRTLNEDQLMRELYSRGFVKIELENMTVSDQIRLFAQAECIIAAHGAGLANLVFAQDASVIELFGEKTFPIFFHISEIMGLDYGCTFCDTQGEDIHVDIEEVTTLLKAV